MNLLGPLVMGQKMTQELLYGTIEEIKKEKVRVARDLLKDYEARR